MENFNRFGLQQGCSLNENLSNHHHFSESENHSIHKKKAQKTNRQFLETLNDIYLKNVMKNRQTKIISNLSSNKINFEFVESLFQEGSKSFMVNMGILNKKDLENLTKIRDQLEQQYNAHIPVLMTLKGTIQRIGEVSPNETQLKKGQQLRLLGDPELVGTSQYVGVSSQEFIDKIKVNDSIIMDFGQVRLTVKAIEDLQTLVDKLKEQLEDIDDQVQMVRQRVKSHSSIELSEAEKKIDKIHQLKRSSAASSYSQESDISSESKYLKDHPNIAELKKILRSKRKLKVLVCEVESDCLLISYKPIFHLKEAVRQINNERIKLVVQQSQEEQPFKKKFESGENQKENCTSINKGIVEKNIFDLDSISQQSLEMIDEHIQQKKQIFSQQILPLFDLPLIPQRYDKDTSKKFNIQFDDLNESNQVQRDTIPTPSSQYSKMQKQDVDMMMESIEINTEKLQKDYNSAKNDQFFMNKSTDLEQEQKSKQHIDKMLKSLDFLNPNLKYQQTKKDHNAAKKVAKFKETDVDLMTTSSEIQTIQQMETRDFMTNSIERVNVGILNNTNNNINTNSNSMNRDIVERSMYQESDDDYLTQRDMSDIQNGILIGIDVLILPKIQNAQQIKFVRDNFKLEKSNIKLIARIQLPEGKNNFINSCNNHPIFNSKALKQIQEILKQVDGIIIMRSFLMIHIPVEKLHFQVKELISLANSKNKQVYVAGNILDSMVNNFIPSNSEGSDISNLVMESIDAVVFNAETSYGKFPIECIRTFTRIAMETEKHKISNFIESPTSRLLYYKRSPEVELAYNIKASLIILFSSDDSYFQIISKAQPPCPVIVVCNDQNIARYLVTVYGVVPLLIEIDQVTLNQSNLNIALKFAIARKFLKKGEPIELIWTNDGYDKKTQIQIIYY